MTKVEVSYDLAGELTDVLMDRIARAHGHYGLQQIRVSEDLTGITVLYDASRMMITDVKGVLARLGIPVKEKAAPAPDEEAKAE